MSAKERLIPKTGFVEFASCDGCLRTIAITDEVLLAIAVQIEIVQFRLASVGVYTGHFDLLFVEGTIETEAEAEELRELRARTSYMVALGTCAYTGGMPGRKTEEEVERQKSGACGLLTVKQGPHLPRRISDIVPIDAFIPGCPIDIDHFLTAVKVLLSGGLPKYTGESMCSSCVLQGNECIIGEGCLGPITNDGCNAVCIANNIPCFGCRGFVPNAKVDLLIETLDKKGFRPQDTQRKISLYNNLTLKELEKEKKL